MKRILKLTRLGLLATCFCAHAAAPTVTPLGALATPFHGPARVAADAHGNLYVADPAAGCVTVCNAFGQILATHDGLAKPLAIAIASDGRIYLAEEGSGSVSVYDGQWRLLYQLGAGPGEFQLPGQLAVDPSAPDKIYVSDGAANVVRLYSGAALAGQFGGTGTGNGQFNFPAGMGVRTNGEVFVVDQNNDRVEVFTNAVYERQFKLGSGGMTGPSGRSQALLLDSGGRLYVADTLNGVVNVFNADNGAALGVIGSFGSAPGQLNLPLGLAMDGYNRLFVASANNSRVELFGLDAFLDVAIQGTSGTIAAGSDLVFSATCGAAGQSFQWRKNGANIAGATGATLFIARAAKSDSGNYSVIVTGTSGSITSGVAPVLVMLPPAILSGPSDQKVRAGTAVNFSVLATGDALRFQWQFNGVDIAGATNATLILPDAEPGHSGQYAVLVTNTVGSLAAPAANLTVVAPPQVMDIVSAGSPFGLTVNLDAGYNYVLEASTNLAGWQVLTNLSTAGLNDLVDRDATNFPTRFYRLGWLP